MIMETRLPGHQRNRQALENRVEQNHRRAHHHRQRRQQHGTEPDHARLDDRFGQRPAFRQAQFDEVHEDDGIAHHDARAGHEADHRSGREKRAQHTVRRQNADQRERNHHHDNQRREERPEPADHQDVNQHQHRGEGHAEVAEDLNRDVPFAVPFDGRLVVGERHVVVVDFQRRAVAAEFARVEPSPAPCSFSKSHRPGFQPTPATSPMT